MGEATGAHGDSAGGQTLAGEPLGAFTSPCEGERANGTRVDNVDRRKAARDQ